VFSNRFVHQSKLLFSDLAFVNLHYAVLVALELVEVLLHIVVVLEDELPDLVGIHSYTLLQVALQYVWNVLFDSDHLEQPLPSLLLDLLLQLILVFGKSLTFIAELPNEYLPATSLVKDLLALFAMNVGVATQFVAVLAFSLADVGDAAFDAVFEHLCDGEDVIVVLSKHMIFEISWVITSTTAAPPRVTSAAFGLAHSTTFVQKAAIHTAKGLATNAAGRDDVWFVVVVAQCSGSRHLLAFGG
jgi:hypothetical protein